MSIDAKPLLARREVPIDSWELALNTAMSMGGDVVRLAARVDAQCELHGWVEEYNRRWLASTIEVGLRSGLLRTSYQDSEPIGWAGVAALLRSDAQGEVVMSYSVADRFPKGGCWELAMRELRQRAPLLELEPTRWDAYRFGHGLSAMDLMAHDWEQRLDDALILRVDAD